MCELKKTQYCARSITFQDRSCDFCFVPWKFTGFDNQFLIYNNYDMIAVLSAINHHIYMHIGTHMQIFLVMLYLYSVFSRNYELSCQFYIELVSDESAKDHLT